MLKNNRQRGSGLKLVATHKALDACFETTSRPGLEGLVLYRWYLAQQYITRPLLINGRKSGLRVWVLMPDFSPLRVYIHKNGLVLFSSATYDASTITTAGGDIAPGHVTNYAMNEDADVWPLEALQAHLGRGAFGALWRSVCRTCARVFAAALGRILEVHAQIHVAPHAHFQLFGVDFLVDEGPAAVAAGGERHALDAGVARGCGGARADWAPEAARGAGHVCAAGHGPPRLRGDGDAGACAAPPPQRRRGG